MAIIPEVLSLIPNIPTVDFVALLGLGCIGLAFFTVHAVVTLAKTRDK